MQGMEPGGLIQMQLRQNNDELLDYLKGLNSWEEEMKDKDQKLTKNKSILKEKLPPVRNAATRSRKQEKQKKKKKKETVMSSSNGNKSNRIHSYDYKAWDQFDVDKACEKVDYEVQSSSESEVEGEGGSEGEGGGEGGGGCESKGRGEKEAGEGIEESSEDEEMERQRMMAIAEKEKGNVLYKKGKYESAVECYSRGMLLDPLSAALPANRALALMKLERYAAVEEDCNTALALEDGYVKAYLRRGVARRHLGKYSDAIEDFEQVLKLEPTNKQGATELKAAQKLKEDEKRRILISEGHVFPVKRAVHLRSKRPLKRVVIEDISGQVEASTASDVKPPITEDAVEHDTHEHVITPNHQSSEIIVQPSVQEGVVTGSTDPADEEGRDRAALVPQTALCPPASDGQVEKATDNDSSCALPPLPETTFEFQSHWKQLRTSRPQLIAYFKRLAPSSYPALLQQSLETDIFSEIISVLREDSNDRKDISSCIERLTWLTRVSRFSVAVMFLSKKDKNNLQSMFVELLDASSSDSTVLKTLASKYNVKL